MPGEQVSRGVSSESTLSPLSLFFTVALLGAAPVRGALGAPALAASPAATATTTTPAAAPAVPAAVLASAEEAIRAACGCERFTLHWSIAPGVAALAASLDSLTAVPDAGVLRALSGEAERISASAGDRVPVRLCGYRQGHRAEYLAEAEPLCGGALVAAARTVRAGTVLQAGDLQRVEGWYSPSAWREAPPVAEGLEARHPLEPGRPLRRDDLAAPALVRRGATVRVTCRLGLIAIEGTGAVRKDGCLGERVALRLAGAAKDCIGVVTGPGEVSVEGEGGGS
jgi:flagella basal body P-ring formation protein FlgA